MSPLRASGDCGPIYQMTVAKRFNGIDIATSAQLLRRYVVVETDLLWMLAGWFIAAPAYETKYAIAHRLLDHADHVEWLRNRLEEMRGGQIRAGVEPELSAAVRSAIDAPDAGAFMRAYLEIETNLFNTYRDHLAACDPAANAVEIRLLRKMISDLERHLETAGSIIDRGSCPHSEQVRSRLAAVRGCSGFDPASAAVDVATDPTPFRRPKTIILDQRIHRGELMHDDQRRQSDPSQATIEDFKVFFNELYAACLLASILFDCDQSEVSWAFMYDVARHFWDESRHSEFGATRLSELNHAPAVCNPILFEQSEGMPILHRFCYLTMGLETYFMPRKRPRLRRYEELGDTRSQLFADQDWNDETLHVTFGKRWIERLLENDFRTVEDILEEVRVHMELVSGTSQKKILAPF